MKKNFISNILIISIAHFIHDTYTSFLSPILPLLIEKLGLSLKMAGLLSVIRSIPSLFNPLIGIITDKISLRLFVVLAPSIVAISMSLIGLSPNIYVLAILLFISGIGSALFHVPAPVIIKKTAENKKGLGMSFYMLGGELARTVGPLIILGAVSLWGLKGIYRLIPAGIIASFLIYFNTKNIKYLHLEHEKKSTTKISHSFKEFLPVLKIIIGISFFRTLLKSSLTLYLPTYLTKCGFSLVKAGIALSIFQFSGAVGTLISGPLSDKIGRKNTLILQSICIPPLSILFLNFNTYWTKIIILSVLGLSIFGSTPVILALVHDIKTKHPSFINGLYMASGFFLGSIASLIIGTFGDILGLHYTIYIASILSTISILFSFMI